MKTPDDAARRWRQRQLDEMRGAISKAEARLAALTQVLETVQKIVSEERRIAASDSRIDFGRFAETRRAEAAELETEMANAEIEIEALRAELQERFEALKPLDFASDKYRATARSAAHSAEIIRLDDAAARRR